jgi:hypothetical protein
MLSSNSFSGILNAFIYSLISFFMIIILYTGFSKIQQSYFPLVDNVHIKYAKSFEDDPSLTSVTLYFNKNYDCVPLLNTFAWYISKDVNGMPYYDRTYFELPTSPGSISRPIGKNISEKWLINYQNGFEDFKRPQKIIFHHRCLGFLKIKTVIDIPPLEERIEPGS